MGVRLFYIASIFKLLVPFLVALYLTKYFGSESWGEYAISLSLAQILDVIIQYGFMLSGAREIALLKDDLNGIGRYVYGVLIARLMIVLALCLPVYFIVKYYPFFNENNYWVMAAFCYAIGNGFNNMWFFQGIQKLGVVSVVDIVLRIVSLILIVVFVNAYDDIWLTLFFQGLMSFILFILSIFWIKYNYGVIPIRFTNVLNLMKQNVSLLLSRLSSSLYSQINSILLVFYLPPKLIGFYALAEKGVQVAVALISPIVQVIYPKVVLAANNSFDEYIVLWRKFSFKIVVFGGVLSIILLFVGPIVIAAFFDGEFVVTEDLLKVMFGVPFLISIGACYTTLRLLVFKFDKIYSMIILGGLLLNILLIPIIVPKYGVMGMGFIYLIVTTTVLLFSVLLGNRLICSRHYELHEDK